METARLVGRTEADWVLGTDLISRITVQTCRQSGLSLVYTELLDFDGDEIYFTEQPSLAGKTYAEAQLAFADCTVIGVLHGGCGVRESAGGDRDRGGRPAHRHRRRRQHHQARDRRCAGCLGDLDHGGAEARPRAHARARLRTSGCTRCSPSWTSTSRRARKPLWSPTTRNRICRARQHDGAIRTRGHDEPRRAGGARSGRLRPHHRARGQGAPGPAALGCSHAGDAAEPPRDRIRDRPADQRRQRDARRPQPRARGGDPGRRLHRQRPADQPDALAAQREREAQRGLRRAVQLGGQRGQPQGRRPLREARHAGRLLHGLAAAASRAARPRSATGSARRREARPTATAWSSTRRSRGSTRSRMATRSSCSRRARARR